MHAFITHLKALAHSQRRKCNYLLIGRPSSVEMQWDIFAKFLKSKFPMPKVGKVQS